MVVFGLYFSIKMFVCTTTKPPNKEAFSTSDHERKAGEKICETDPESMKESGS